MDITTLNHGKKAQPKRQKDSLAKTWVAICCKLAFNDFKL